MVDTTCQAKPSRIEEKVKNPDPKDRLCTAPRGGFHTLSSLRQYVGVMEWWSNGVMKGMVQVEIHASAFSNTPILQYSKTARTSTDKAIELLPGPKVQVFNVE
jgi:hypothetical protein